jgi:hypothetical protein
VKARTPDPHPHVDRLYELWRRGDKLKAAGRIPEAIEAWSAFWRAIRSNVRDTSVFHDVEDVWPFFDQLQEWSADFAHLHLDHPGRDDRAATAGLAFVDEFLATFPGEDMGCVLVRGERGALLFRLGRGAEAREHFESMIREHPASGGAYVAFADALKFSADDGPTIVEHVKKILRRALAHPIEDDDIWNLRAWLHDLEKRTGRGRDP